MANREAAERVCRDSNPIIDGRKANVNLAYLGAKQRGIHRTYPHLYKIQFNVYGSIFVTL